MLETLDYAIRIGSTPLGEAATLLLTSRLC